MKTESFVEFRSFRSTLIAVFVPATVVWGVTLVWDGVLYPYRQPLFILLACYYGSIAIGAARAMRRERAARRRAAGLCINCGYDLRASTERCPECGEAIEPDRPTPRKRSWAKRVIATAIQRLNTRRSLRFTLIASAITLIVSSMLWYRASSNHSNEVRWGYIREDGRLRTFDLCTSGRTIFIGTMVQRPWVDADLQPFPVAGWHIVSPAGTTCAPAPSAARNAGGRLNGIHRTSKTHDRLRKS